MSAGQGRGQPAPPTAPSRACTRGLGSASNTCCAHVTSCPRRESTKPLTRTRTAALPGVPAPPAPPLAATSRYPRVPPPRQAPVGEALGAGAPGPRYSQPPSTYPEEGPRSLPQPLVLANTHATHHFDVGILSQEAVAGHGLETKETLSFVQRELEGDGHPHNRARSDLPSAAGGKPPPGPGRHEPAPQGLLPRDTTASLTPRAPGARPPVPTEAPLPAGPQTRLLDLAWVSLCVSRPWRAVEAPRARGRQAKCPHRERVLIERSVLDRFCRLVAGRLFLLGFFLVLRSLLLLLLVLLFLTLRRFLKPTNQVRVNGQTSLASGAQQGMAQARAAQEARGLRRRPSEPS